MQKLTTEKYNWLIHSNETGHEVRLFRTDTGAVQVFQIKDPTVRLKGLEDHMNSLTDELCDFWLDPEAQEKAKALAKEAAKAERLRIQAQAEKERQEKIAKKEENKRKQREALQRKQEAQSN